MKEAYITRLKSSVVGGVLAFVFAFIASPTYAATPADACFTFDGGTGTITGYEAPGGANNCPSDVDIPSTIDVAGVPTAVTAIGDGAFMSNNLTSVTMPNTVTAIGTDAFNNNQLTSATLSTALITINNNAFSYNQLTSIAIPNTVTSIGSSAFKQNQLTSANWPNGITSISDSVFMQNKLTSFTIPVGVTIIGSQALEGNNIAAITIPNTVTAIEGEAFGMNRLTRVDLPASVTSVSEGAFIAQSMMDGATVYSSNPGTPIFKQLTQTTWYVKVYTANPSNPSAIRSSAVIFPEAMFGGGADVNNNGTTDDLFTVGGHIINPVQTVINYHDTAGISLRPSGTSVGALSNGAQLSDYVAASAGAEGIPAYMDPTTFQVADPQAVSDAVEKIFFVQNKSYVFTAPTIAGYTLQSPASPHTMTLTNQQNDLTFVYAANGSNTTNAAPSAPNSGGINAQTVLLGNVFLYGIGVLVSIIGLYTAAHIARKH